MNASAVTRTVRSSVAFNGLGLHGGQAVTMQVGPAPAGHGILFRRTDLAPGTGDIPARWDHVVDTRLCTRLGNEHGASVGTVEHLMAALAGCGVTDALVTLAGPEVPIMDGSAAPFVAALLRAGVVETGRRCRAIRIRETVIVEQDGKRAELRPGNRFEMAFAIEFDDPAIGAQRHALPLVDGAFVDELGDCRTFGHLGEVEQLRAMGLARGGSLKNAIVVDRGRVLNPEGLRRPDEFVRHKMLDAVGDLALAGAPIVGRFVAHRGGHEMTNRLLRALFARPEAWSWIDLRPGQWFGGVAAAPDSGRDLQAVAV
jgi:UDP-3-O-[3-hydroxymyristoyl] N-acetylglucosamine deacetylase